MMELSKIFMKNVKLANDFIEDYFTIFAAVHGSTFTLFAIGVVCCLYLHQIHLFIFLPCVFTILINNEKVRRGVLIYTSCIIALNCLAVQVAPIDTRNLNVDVWSTKLDVLEDKGPSIVVFCIDGVPYNESRSNFEVDDDVSNTNMGVDCRGLASSKYLTHIQEIEEERVAPLLVCSYFVILMLILMNSKLMLELKTLNLHSGVILQFPNIQLTNSNKSFSNFFKYMVNFTFCKIGLELCWFCIVVLLVMGLNPLDMISMVFLWLCLYRRSLSEACWPYLRISLAISLALKYLMLIYNKRFSLTFAQCIFCFNGLKVVSIVDESTASMQLIWHLFVLVLVNRQQWVFDMPWDYYGGTNIEIWQYFDEPGLFGRSANYILFKKSMLDRVKALVLPAIPHLALIVILLNGIFRGTAINFIYIVMIMVMFLKNEPIRFAILPFKTTYRRWWWLQFYSLLLVTGKYFIYVLMVYAGMHSQLMSFSVPCLFDIYCPLLFGEALVNFREMMFQDAIHFGMLTMVKRFICSSYYMPIWFNARSRDFLDEWGSALLHKASVEQVNKRQEKMDKLKERVERDRKANVDSLLHDDSLISKDDFYFGFHVELKPDSKPPYKMTEWFWSTSMSYRFMEYSYDLLAKEIRQNHGALDPECKPAPTEERMDELWQSFLHEGLVERLRQPPWLQLLHAIYTSVHAHSEYVCYLMIMNLNWSAQSMLLTMFFPFSIIFATWSHPRPPNWYWTALLKYVMIMIIIKYHLFSRTYLTLGVNRFLGEYVSLPEYLLLALLIWHRSNLSFYGLWHFPLNLSVVPVRGGNVDTYMATLFLLFTNFLLVSLSFGSFAAEDSDAGVRDYVERNNMPLSWFLVVYLHLLLLLLDRCLYISGARNPRQWFQAFVWAAMLQWLFVILPEVTNNSFHENVGQVIYYWSSNAYILLSSYQATSKRSRNNVVSFLYQSYGLFSYCMVKIYSAIPFVDPIRRMLDFFFTKTLLTREDFVYVESIFNEIYEAKCERTFEANFLSNRRARTKIKTIIGVFAIITTVTFLFIPIIYFLIDEQYTPPNPISFFRMTVSAPTLGTIYEQEVDSFEYMSEDEWRGLTNVYRLRRNAVTFLSDFRHSDVFVAHLPTYSLQPWHYTLSRKNISVLLSAGGEIHATVRWEVQREKAHASFDYGNMVSLIKDRWPQKSHPELYSIDILAKMVAADDPEKFEPIQARDIIPKYLHFSKFKKSEPIYQLTLEQKKGATDGLLALRRTEDGAHFVWELRENCSNAEYKFLVSRLPKDTNCRYLDIYLLADHMALIEWISEFGGMLAMYVGMVFTLWSFFAPLWQQDLPELMYEEMVYPDRVLKLCMEIYQCRIFEEIELELELSLKLIGIFCSPNKLEIWTRPPNDQDEPRQSVTLPQIV